MDQVELQADGGGVVHGTIMLIHPTYKTTFTGNLFTLSAADQTGTPDLAYQTNNAMTTLSWSRMSVTDDAYSQVGQYFFGNAPFWQDMGSLTIRAWHTYTGKMPSAVVPEPGTVWLMGLGLAGLWWRKRPALTLKAWAHPRT